MLTVHLNATVQLQIDIYKQKEGSIHPSPFVELTTITLGNISHELLQNHKLVLSEQHNFHILRVY